MLRGCDFNPQIAFLLSPLKNLTVKATASRKTRFPTIKELFAPDSGNPDLEPMRANIFELGGELEVNTNWSLSLVGFYNDVSNLIGRLHKDDPYENIDAAVFKGIETGLEWKNRDWMFIRLFYTYLKAIDKSEAGTGYIEHRPAHKIDVATSLKLPARFYLNVDIGYVSSQIYFK